MYLDFCHKIEEEVGRQEVSFLLFPVVVPGKNRILGTMTVIENINLSKTVSTHGGKGKKKVATGYCRIEGLEAAAIALSPII